MGSDKIKLLPRSPQGGFFYEEYLIIETRFDAMRGSLFDGKLTTDQINRMGAILGQGG